MNNSVSTGRICMKFDIWVFLKKFFQKIQVSLKSDKNNGYFTWRQIYTYDLSRSILLRMRNISDKSCRENRNTFNVQQLLFFFENCAVYEILWRNTVDPGRPQMIIWRMRTASWIPKATNTHSEYLMLTAFPLQQWLHKRASMLRYTYISCLVSLQGINWLVFITELEGVYWVVRTVLTQNTMFRR